MAKVLIFGNFEIESLLAGAAAISGLFAVFSSGKAEIVDVNRCVGDVSFLIFVLFSMFVMELMMMMMIHSSSRLSW